MLNIFKISIFSALFFTSISATAGTYGDDFGKCLVKSSSDQDKQELMEWIFASISLNPKLATYVSIPKEDRVKIDTHMAVLFNKLIGESCHKEAADALKYEGSGSFAVAFQLLGQVAGQQLFASPEVTKGSENFIKLVDLDALQKKLSDTKP